MKPSIQGQSIRYSSNSSYNPLRSSSKQNRDQPSSPSEPAVPSEQQTESRPSPRQSEFDRIIGNLSLNNASQQQQQQQDSAYYPSDPAGGASGAGGRAEGPNTLTRSVADSAATENSRVVPRVELKLGPSLGRQVHVEPDRGFDLAAALRTMNAACSQNKILQQQRKQKFHIRRGQMRKNLRMERWRKLFKFSFDHTVSKIQRMRAQGW